VVVIVVVVVVVVVVLVVVILRRAVSKNDAAVIGEIRARNIRSADERTVQPGGTYGNRYAAHDYIIVRDTRVVRA